jgi:hypothetical protein
MDAIPHRALDGIQSHHGLHSVIIVVCGKNVLLNFFNHVVSLDVSAIEN